MNGLIRKIEQENQIYGTLNQTVKEVEYVGGTTNTATVHVNGNVITADANVDVEKLKAEYSQILIKFDQVQVYFKQVQQEIASYESRFAEQDTKIAAMATQVSSYDSKFGEYTQKLNIFNAELKNLDTKIEQVKTDVQAIIDTRLAQVEKEIKQLKRDIEQIKTELIAEIESKIQDVYTKIAELEDKFDEIIEKALVSIKASIAQINKQITTINTGITTLQSQVKTNTSSIKANKVAIDDLTDRLNNISETILPLIESKISELSKQVDVKLNVLDTKINRVTTNLDVTKTELTEQISAVKATTNSAITRLDRVEPDVATLNTQVEKITETLDSKLDTKVYNADQIIVNKTLSKKGGGMYYDTTGAYDPSHQGKSYWWMTANNDTTDPEIIAGPYNFGTGGGGGGGGGTITTKVSVKAVDWPSTVSSTSKCILSVDWSSTKDDTPTGNGLLAVYVGDTICFTRKNIKQGRIDDLDLTEYLSEGSNSVEVRVTDAYNNSDKVIQQLTVVNIKLESVFVADDIYSGTVKYTYKPYGDKVLKTTHFIVDGTEAGTQQTTLSGEQQTFPIEGLTHGPHSLRVYFDCIIEGNIVYSNDLVYDLMYEVSGETAPIITSTFDATVVQEQYTAFSIPYKVYTPGHDRSDIKLMVDDNIVAQLSVSQKMQSWEYSPKQVGTFVFKIVCGETERLFNITVKESEIDVHAVTEDLKLYLTSTGRSNYEAHPEIWNDEDNGIYCTLSNFNFVSDGWQQDNNGNTVLRVTGDARVEIPYKPFAWSTDEITKTGKTIELEFSTADVRDYETELISCASAAEIFDRDVNCVEILGRTKQFYVKIDGDVFSTKVGKQLGAYTFNYQNEWTLNEEVIELVDYGITLEEEDIPGTEPKKEDSFLYPGDSFTVTYSEARRGFYVTPQLAKLRSQQSELQTQFKEDEHSRITFVVDKKNETRIMYLYINGIMCGAYRYPASDNFLQINPVNITIGSNDATINIYNIRIYDNNLTRKQVVNNWIADTQSGELKKQRYVHNDNCSKDSGEIIISKLPSDLPYIIWDVDPLPQYKGDKKKGQAYYTDPTNSKKNFHLPTKEGVGQGTYNVQGTSSSVYPVKNIRLKSTGGFIDDDLNVNPYFYVTEGGIGANYFTFKVDYASSEGANNVELTKLYNDIAKANEILNPAQKIDSKIRVGIDGFPIVAFHRTADGVDSFCTKANFNNDKANEEVYGFSPGDESWEITNNSAEEANFKKAVTPETFENAFEIRYPDESDYSDLTHLQPMTEWVVSTDPEQATNNLLAEPIQYTYKTVVRSEDGTYGGQTVISPVFTNDTAEYRRTKFKAELANWFDIDSTVFYYIFTHIFLMIDSRAKNAFPTYFASRDRDEQGKAKDGGDKWFWLPYDMDTAIGINNEGKLVFDYNLEDTDKLDGADVYNGQGSVIWNNLRVMFDGEIGQMYANLRTSSNLLNYTEVENRFETHQAKWSETIFNEDSYKKYIKVLLDGGDNYLEMLQGSKAEQRKWWLYNRFKYFDSKYLAGDAKRDVFQFRAYGKADITLVPYADIYATVSYANSAGAVVSTRATRNNAYTLKNPLPASASDQETYIYSASQLKSVGDLSPFKPDTVKAANAIKLQELKVGDDSEVEAEPAVAIKVTDTEIKSDLKYHTRSELPAYTPGYLVDAEGYKYTYVASPTVAEIDKYYTMSNYGTDKGTYTNYNLKELTLGKNTLLKTLNVMNCVNLTQAIDISNCTNIEEVYFDNTRIEGLTLPEGGILKILHLPRTLKSLIIKDQPALQVVQIPGTYSVQSLWIENIPDGLLDAQKIMMDMPAGGDVRYYGFSMTVQKAEEIEALFKLLDTKQGKRDDGTLVQDAQVGGTIYINTISYADYMKLTNWYKDGRHVYQDVKIVYDNLKCTVNWWNTDPLEPYKQELVNFGESANKPAVDPTKESTVQYDYIFTGWDQPYDKVEGDLDIHALYTEQLREYEFTFNLQSTIPEPIPSQKVKYGHIANRPPDPKIKGAAFNGWFNTSACLEGDNYDFDTPVIGPKTIYASWTDTSKPTVEVGATNTKTFHYVLKDNIAVVAWAINTTDEEPAVDEWNYIEPTALYEDDWTITKAATYYVWAKDASNKCTNKPIIAYNISKTHTTGNTISIIDAVTEEEIDTCALQTSKLKILGTLEPHYEKLKLLINDIEPETNPCIINSLNEDIHVKTESSPEVYDVKFNTGERGEAVDPQYIVYNNKVEQPIPQYEKGEILDSWYTDEQLSRKWDFKNDVVTESMTLYAHWSHYEKPTVITVAVADSETLTCNFIQGIDRGVEINWGEAESSVESILGQGRQSIKHTYAVGGTYNIEITFREGENYLGGAAWNAPVIVPAECMTNVEFAYNMLYTAQYAFYGAKSLTTVELSPYMTKINIGMFRDCTNLQTVILSENIRRIEESAFQNCSSLCKDTHEFTVGEQIVFIGDFAFAACSEIHTFNLPDKITEIGSGAFQETGITEFVAPAGLTSLNNSLLNSCEELTNVELHANVAELGAAVFYNCKKLRKVVINATSLIVTSSDAGAFGDCYELKTAGPLGSGCNIEFNFITKIPDSLFMQSELESVQLPEGITEIGNQVFGSAEQLLTINLPISLTTIGARAFSRCCKLNNVTLPENLTVIGQEAFFQNESLTKISIPLSVGDIGFGAFSNCFGLKDVYIHTTTSETKITTYGTRLPWFDGCSQLNQLKSSARIHVSKSLLHPETQFGACWNCYGIDKYDNMLFIDFVADL